ncbi:hypothetical protein N9H19_00875 [Flavobacteriales bacterium]|nr:hypothetical protein [Flavobacteriales bacterium]
MKNLFLLLFAVVLYSCGYNREEQMLYDFENQVNLDLFSADLKEFNFEIISTSMEEIITCEDSANYFLEIFVDANKIENVEVVNKNYVDSLLNEYDLIIAKGDEYIALFDVLNVKPKEYNEVVNNNKYLKKIKKSTIYFKENYFNYKSRGEEKLSTRYNCKFKVDNPFLKISQTHNKNYYTNSIGNKFIFSTNIE